MMINMDYAQIVNNAKSSNAQTVNFDQRATSNHINTTASDKVTLSDKALALMKGVSYDETPPSYIKPTSARQLLSEQVQTKETVPSNGDRFEKVMQDVLDRRLGVDRKKLEELDALMEEIAKNENLSPEEKEKALEQLQEMREKVIEESLEVQKTQRANDEMNELT